jgi:hypothetical protein
MRIGNGGVKNQARDTAVGHLGRRLESNHHPPDRSAPEWDPDQRANDHAAIRFGRVRERTVDAPSGDERNDLGYEQSRLSSSDRSVDSQLKSLSDRPKCP